jgi:hypothetical protein
MPLRVGADPIEHLLHPRREGNAQSRTLPLVGIEGLIEFRLGLGPEDYR